METIQLGPRSERTHVSCNALQGHRVLRLEAGSDLLLHGTVHRSCTCAILSASPEPAVRLLGLPLRVTDLVLAGADARLNLFVPRGAAVFILIVPSSEAIPSRTLRVCDAADAQMLTRKIRQQIRGGNIATLANHVSKAFAASQIVPLASGRVSAVMSVCNYIERRFPAALKLGELSRVSGVGDRTLEYGFREVCGTTPMSFVRSLRLSRSRLALMQAKRYTPINVLAKASGFTHMGQFSRDYHRWFGETPSTTLAKGRY